MLRVDLVDRLVELPYRIGHRTQLPNLSWPLSRLELSRVQVTWPSVYQWPPSADIVATLRDALRKLCSFKIERTSQTYQGVIMLTCHVDGKPHNVALDYSDYPSINPSALADSALYIKLECAGEGYGDGRIIPGGYPATGLDYYAYYLHFRRKYEGRRHLDVVGRFGYRFQAELRKRAVALLSSAADIDFVGNTGKVRYSRFLREAASARLCLHLPGNGPFTHRVAEFLGLGTCMVSIPFTTRLHVPIEPGVHYVEVANDLSDLVEKCRYYIRHEDERERIARAGREHFDKYLHCDQLAAYYVRSLLDRLA